MRALIVAILIMSLAACAKQPVRPSGTYRLDIDATSLVLQVRTGGDYVLQVDGPGRISDEIRGRWEQGTGAVPGLSFHGIVWHGAEPEAGQGIWTVPADSERALCLGGEQAACFAKDKAG